MPKFALNIEGVRGDAVERFATLANKSAEELILEWIKDKLDHATVQAMRAEGKPWVAIAEALGNSTTQARRIYAQGLDMPLVSKENIRILERYVDIIERAAEIRLVVPTEDDLDRMREYKDLLPAFEDKTPFPVPSDEDLDKMREYQKLLPAEDE